MPNFRVTDVPQEFTQRPTQGSLIVNGGPGVLYMADNSSVSSIDNQRAQSGGR